MTETHTTSRNSPNDLPSRQSQQPTDIGQQSNRLSRTTSSMLWSAWADALGFISELTDAQGLKRRLSGRSFDEPVAWRRRVGGKFGVQASLPRGCYSDDTQLRLATGRAISGHGFDVEAFARVELTVWPTYALGGGRASRAAATAMAKATASWHANFYDNWHNAGGNGVAMRIQPHIWAATDLASEAWLEAILVNGAVSHGHPRALVGACLIGAALAFALDRTANPAPDDWPTLLDTVTRAVEAIDHRPELATIWRPSWEAAAKMPLTDSWTRTLDECRALLEAARPSVQRLSEQDPDDSAALDDAWAHIVTSLALNDDATRGSGTTTVVAALALIAAIDDPRVASQVAARAVGTDTDTIATMAAAVIAAGSDSPAPTGVQDDAYLRGEAARLTAIAEGQPAAMFAYPDLLRFVPPKSQLDGVACLDDEFALAGLGILSPIADEIVAKDACWQWMQTSFGPSMLVKRRLRPKQLLPPNAPATRAQTSPGRLEATPVRRRDESDSPDDVPAETVDRRQTAVVTALPRPEQPTTAPPDSQANVNVDQMLTWVKGEKYSDNAVGYAVIRLSTVGSLEQLIAFTAAVRAHLRP